MHGNLCTGTSQACWQAQLNGLIANRPTDPFKLRNGCSLPKLGGHEVTVPQDVNYMGFRKRIKKQTKKTVKVLGETPTNLSIFY